MPRVLSVCGDGVVDPRSEWCDQCTQNGTPGSCCTVNCTFRPRGDVCRPAQDPVCDNDRRIVSGKSLAVGKPFVSMKWWSLSAIERTRAGPGRRA